MGILNITNSLLLMAAFFNGGLTVFILRDNARKESGVLFGSFLFALSLWALALIGFETADNQIAILYFAKITYLAALSIATSFYLFSLYFPEGQRPRNPHVVISLAVPAVYALALVMLPNFLIREVVEGDAGRAVLLGAAEYWTFASIFSLLFIGALIRLWVRYFRQTGGIRTQILVIATSVSVAGAAGVYYNLILASPYIANFQYLWTGPLFTTFIAVTIMYSVFRFHLFNSKVIATEFLIGLLWIFTFLRTMLAVSSTDRLFNGILFVLSLAIGSVLIRSVRAEVRAREQIEQLSAEKSEFMSFASHEIRNPITAMRGYASLISDGTTGEISITTKTAADNILATGNQVLMLIAQFLDKSKLELGQIQFARETFDLAKAATSVSNGFIPSAMQHGLKIVSKIDSPGLLVTGDETKLKEVVGNLIDNSIKYTPSGGVTVSVEKHNGRGRVTISDTGVGIAKDVIPHLFQKFSRADAKRMNLRGTGLGLYLGKAFIEGMGGKIWVESGGDGQGAHFIIELPSA